LVFIVILLVSLKDVYHFQLYGPNSPWYHTRLRPGTLNFLKNIDPLYELHICTFGARNYAHMICAFLDENGRLFSHRILSRDECLNATSKKDNLKALFPDDCGDAMVCIIDDREDVWNHATNLIQVKPYHFFQHTGDINAPPGLAKKELDGKGVDFNKIKLQKIKKKVEKPAESQGKSEEKPETSKTVDDSSESTEKAETEEAEMPPATGEADDGSKTPPATEDTKEEETKDDNEDNLVEIQDPDDYLLYLESILKLIHTKFYKIYDKSKEIPDLKQLVPKLKAKVLVGVKIVFSGLVPNIVKLERSRPYLIAKNLGAEVTENITETTTHLVAASTGTQKAFQAQKNKKIKIVTPGWLWTCAERWEHVDEMLYPLSTSKTHKMRQIPAHCSPDRVPESDDVKFNNPYLQMSDGDIAEMEAEVETSSESESDNAPPEAERPSRKRKRSGEKEAEKQPATVDISGNGEDENSSDSGKSGRSSSGEDEEESPSAKFRRGEHPSTSQTTESLIFLLQAKKFHRNSRSTPTIQWIPLKSPAAATTTASGI
jgi:RNA polymerase II subunit A-like phosphatase